MPRKSRSYKKPRRSTRRKKNTRVSRIVAFAIGFIVLLFFGLYGINYLKQNASSDLTGRRLSISEMNDLISEVDNGLTRAFFNAGISSKNIKSRKVYDKEFENLTWEYKDISITPEKGVKEGKVKESLEDSLLSKLPVKHEYESGKNSLAVYIKINDVTTHKLNFVFNKQKQVQAKPEKKKPETEKLKDDKTISSDKSKTLSKKENIKTELPKSKIVIIVDDLGQEKKPIDELLKIPAPITFAVLPNLPYSKYAAEKADKKGWDVILHMPMEPKESSGYTGVDAGNEVLLVGLSKEAILAKLNESLLSVPNVKGVNNHMGSKFMENDELTELVLLDLKRKGLFFVDSKTSSDSKGFKTGLKLGMQTAQRDIFLDDSSKDSSYVKKQLEKLIDISKRNGFAVGICHPYPQTVKALSEMIPKIEHEVEVVSISNIVDNGNKIGKN